MEKPLMRSLKDSRSGISQTTGCSFVHAFFHVVSNSLRIPWDAPAQEKTSKRLCPGVPTASERRKAGSHDQR
jgi:hypothetical protein